MTAVTAVTAVLVDRLDWRLKPLIALSGRRPDRDASLPWPERRAQAEALARRGRGLLMAPGPRCEERDVTVPVDGGEVRVRLYRSPGTGSQPLHVFLHGGGWCSGSLYERDPRCREIAVGARCTVASVEYRLAPEHPFPTGLEDCVAALTWLVDHAAEHGVDPDRVSVGGESAGANLAAAVCLALRDRDGPRPCHQWLDVPALDLTLSSPSFAEVPDGNLLDGEAIDEFLACYLTGPDDVTHPYASPLLADDLSGLPPAWTMGCGVDKLRDDAGRYAARLQAAGVPAECTILPGLAHPAFAFTRLLPAARTYERQAVAALARALHDGR